MNIVGGAAFANPVWQTDDLRLGVVAYEGGDRQASRTVVLSCGTRLVARCPGAFEVVPGMAVRVVRRGTDWHIERILDPLPTSGSAP